MDPNTIALSLVIKDDAATDEHLVYGEVYAPMRPDAQGEFMTAPQIRKMAHDFVRTGGMGNIDVMHNNKLSKDASVVESFIASDSDPTFIPGAWVVGVHVPDDDLWNQIKKGDINGFSMEALVSRHDREVDVNIPPIVQGTTSKSEGHEHKFFVTYDDKGHFRGGVTDVVDGHTHPILAGTHTQVVKGHSHRFSSVDDVTLSIVGAA